MNQVLLSKTASKQRRKIPLSVKQLFEDNLSVLQNHGPILPDWVNSGTLDDRIFHCRLNPNWVTYCRYVKEKSEIEVFYVGRKDQAPY